MRNKIRLDQTLSADVKVYVPTLQGHFTGTLTYEPGRGLLLHAVSNEFLDSALKKLGWFKCLYGSCMFAASRGSMASNLHFFRLEDCEKTRSAYANGITSYDFVASSALFSEVSLDSLDTVSAPIESVTLGLDGVDHWLLEDVDKKSTWGDDGHAIKLPIFTPVEATTPHGTRFSLAQFIQSQVSYSPPRAVSTGHFVATVESKEPQAGLRCVEHLATMTRGFISLLLARPVNMNEISFRAAVAPRGGIGGIRYLLPNSAARESLASFEIRAPIPIDLLRPHLGRAWGLFVERYPSYALAVEAFIATDLSSASFMEIDFLSTVQALETYSTKRFDGVHMDRSAFAEIKRSIVASIPPILPQRVRDNIVQGVGRAYTFSLRERLADLLNRLDPSVAGLFAQNLQELFRRAVSTRNRIVHATDFNAETDLTEQQLLSAGRLLRLFFVASVLSDLEIPASTVASGLQRLWEFKSLNSYFASQWR